MLDTTDHILEQCRKIVAHFFVIIVVLLRVAFRAKPPKQLFRSARAMFRSCFFAPITLKKREEKGERKGRKEEKGKEKEGKERIV